MKSWFTVLPLDEGVYRLAAGTLPGRAAAITFDDGYADNFLVALPLLQRHGLTATFFIATGFLDGGRMWNDSIIEGIRRCRDPALDLGADLGHHYLGNLHDRRVAIETLIAKAKYLSPAARNEVCERVAACAAVDLPTDLMLTSEQVQKLRQAGMQIGAHTVSHPMLTKLSAEQAHYEIMEGKAQLEGIVKERIRLFAYPNGKLGDDYTQEHVALVRKIGFDAAVTTNWGSARKGSDLMQLPRFTPWDRSRLRFGARLAANLMAGKKRGGGY